MAGLCKVLKIVWLQIELEIEDIELDQTLALRVFQTGKNRNGKANILLILHKLQLCLLLVGV